MFENYKMTHNFVLLYIRLFITFGSCCAKAQSLYKTTYDSSLREKFIHELIQLLFFLMMGYE